MCRTRSPSFKLIKKSPDITESVTLGDDNDDDGGSDQKGNDDGTSKVWDNDNDATIIG